MIDTVVEDSSTGTFHKNTSIELIDDRASLVSH